MKYLIILLLVISAFQASAQMGSGMKVKDKNQGYVDSIKNSTWPFVFPTWGKKITKKGIDLQYPIGVMVNYLFGSQQVEISDLAVGINGSEKVPLDFIKFGEVKAEIKTLTTRVDLWVLPFLDVYGIFGKTWASTNVNVDAPASFSTKADFDGSTLGMGLTAAGGYHGIFGMVDFNSTWSKLEGIQSSIHSNMVSPRFGYVFHFKNHPERNLTPWVGASGIFINRTTEGSVNLAELGVTGSGAAFQPIIDGTAPFMQNLTLPQQAVVKKLAKEMQSKVQNINFEDINIEYSLKKQATSEWSMSIGAQFQLNKRFQFRSEVGFLGGRKTLLTSANYRFGL